MRILFLRTALYPSDFPGNVRLRNFAWHCAKLNAKVTILALNNGLSSDDLSRYVDEQRKEGISCRLMTIPRFVRRLMFLMDRVVGLFCPMESWDFCERIILEREADRAFLPRAFDVIIATMPSWGCAKLAANLSRKMDVPWIADFRDLPDEFDIERKKRSVRLTVNRLLPVLATASGFITVSKPLIRRLEMVYKLSPVELVSNGYEGCLPPIPPVARDRFRIVYTGVVAYGRTPELLFRGLDLLLDRGIDLHDVEVLFIGSVPSPDIGLKNYKSFRLCKFLGAKSRAVAIEYQRAASILLSLASPGFEGILSSKIFDYVKAGRPVLNIPSDNGTLDEFIKRSRIGVSCADAMSVADFIEKLYSQWRITSSLEYCRDEDFLTSYSRENQTARLYQFANKVIGTCV